MPDAPVRFLDAEATEAALPFPALVEALSRGFARGCIVPTRHHHTLGRAGEPDATLLLMPAWSSPEETEPLLGVKLVSVVPGNAARGQPAVTATYMLCDAATGRQLALIEGNVLTARRTAATSALATRFLSRPDARSLLVLGAGRVAGLLPAATRAVRPIERVAVWNHRPEGAARLVEALRADGFDAEVATDLEAAVREADIVSAATLAEQPLVRGSWLRPGTHLDLVGAFTPAMREADDEAVRRARLFVDTREALHEAGDLAQPIRDGVIAPARILADLAELARGERAGRASAEEITLFKSVGSGLADLAAAALVHSGASRPA